MVFAAILGTLAFAVYSDNGSAIVNGLVVIVLALFPVVVDAVGAVRTGPALSVSLGVAGLLHMIGMLGVYESVWWWDHVTHTVSAGLVAALCYGTLLAATTHSRVVAATMTVGFTLVGGVFWELIELVARTLGRRFKIEPVLVYYGWKDTTFDLVFDLLAALAIVLLDLGVFESLAAQSPALARELLFASTVVLVTGSLAIAGGLTVFNAWPWSHPE